jgi:hypothetical protein
MSRAKKPYPTAANVKEILSRPGRLLTTRERKQRVEFYAGNPHVDATAVEPSQFARQPLGAR